MKIIHMISGGDVGGAKTHVLSLLAGLNKTQSVHMVCFTEGDFAAEARQLGIPTTVIEDNHLLRVRNRILAMIRHDGYQVIHCHGARANLMGMLLRKKAHIPVISTIHSDYRLDYMGRALAALTYGNVNKLALRKFDAWIGVSEGMTKLLISRGFDPQRIYTLYNGVDFSRQRPVLPREEYFKRIGLDVREDSVVFGIAARISPVKDMTTLLRAFSKAVKKHPSLRLAIAGEGEQEAEIRALAAGLCPKEAVCFVGWEKDVDSFYHALDVNLLTSLSETFPYALTEGARMRCATVASEVGGVPYLIDHGKNGLLFPAQDADALAEHMIYLAEHADVREHMGQALYEKTRREFSLDVMIAKQTSIYETILRRAERRKARDGVLICGAYGKGNRGDNAILIAIVKQLRDIDPDLPICVLSRDPMQTRLSARVSSLYTFRAFRIGRLLRKTKLYISGGGTLMQDATSTRSLLYYLYGIRQAKKKGCSVMLYGCGIGPISKQRNRKRTAKTLDQFADVISVRDRYSETFLKELGVTKPAVHLTADPALLIDAQDGSDLRDLSENESYALFALRPWAGYEEDVFAEAAEYVYKTHGLIPILYCMEPARDLPVAGALAKKLTCPYKILEAGENGEQVLCVLGRMALVVSMRLHALIFAAGQGVPLVGVVYDPKVSGFLDYLGQKRHLQLEGLRADALCHMMDDALKDTANDRENIARLRALAAQNETLAAQLLSED